MASLRFAHTSTPIVFAQALALITLLGATPDSAQQLSLRRYDVPDGLAHSEVTSIYQDRKGYIWLTTFEGLSRFDGYSFVNYGVQDGLPHTIANHVTEDPRGRLWVATNGGGIARLIDRPLSTDSPGGEAGRGKFITYAVGDSLLSNRVNRLLFDAQGNLWCLTDFGLYRARAEDETLTFEALVKQESRDSAAVLENRQGRLWFGVGAELIEVNQTQVSRHRAVANPGSYFIRGIIEDHQGRLLVAFNNGLFEFRPAGEFGQGDEWRRLPLSLKPGQAILTMFQDRNGTLWIGTNTALIKYQAGVQTEFASSQGLEVANVRAMAEDRDANLWLGTTNGGAYKIAGEMIVSYTRAQGLPATTCVCVFEDQSGQLKALMSNNEIVAIAGDKIIRRQRFDLPLRANEPITFAVDRGRRIQGGKVGVVNLDYTQPIVLLSDGRKINIAEIIPPEDWGNLIAVYEDERGKLWLITSQRQIFRADPTNAAPLETFQADFTQPLQNPLFISDRAGGLWMGSVEKLWRLRQGKFSEVQPVEGLPETDPRSFYLDSRGWLWIGMRFKGVSLTREPGAEHPGFSNYSTAQGLSNDTVLSIAEDNSGRMYFGTPKGLSQFDPLTGEWRHYTTKDGLPSDRINHLYKDREGNIWVSTAFGVSKFNPRAERRESQAAPIYLSRVNVAGEDLPLGETGAQNIPRVELAPARNNLQIEFVALSYQGEESLLYQYQLEGVDADWSAPGKSRSVNYGRLAPGGYRFLARAVNREGVASTQPATFEFVILRPIWQRLWFVTLAATLAGLLIYAAYRYRIARVVELERVRTRIAADLHDDIGASLSKMAILSEVVKRQVALSAQQSLPMLTDIADSARGLVGSMRDIVWAIDPHRDDLGSVVSRIRQFASDVLEGQGISWDFQTPPELEKIKLGPDQRRHILLFFKEAINNIARHSESSAVSLSIEVAHHQLIGEVRDNGRGFALQPDEQVSSNGNGGHGLENMRRRVSQLRGVLDINSSPGQGTHLKLTMPLKKP